MSRWVSSRNAGLTSDFAGAVIRSLAPDGGLWVPESITPMENVEELLALEFQPRSVAILERLIGEGELSAALPELVARAFNFPVHVMAVKAGVWALELFHGPTLAFKDFGARFLAAVLSRAGARPTVLTATSGDTGSAVARAFFGFPGTRVVVLYPAGKVSSLQEKQFASLGGNVSCFAVEGSFDDCQALAKGCFADAELVEELRLTSANSIHVARWVAQVPYYFEAVARLPREARQHLAISVPSGNFGNLAAGLLAQRLGLPVARFVAATNSNATVPEFLAGAPYRPRPSVETISNAMDVGAPSNWERVRCLVCGDDDTLRRELVGISVNEAETEAAMRNLAASGYLADPHSAVGYAALERTRHPGETGLFLATAHAAKFRETVGRVLGRPVELPPALASLVDRPVLSRPLHPELEELKRALRELE